MLLDFSNVLLHLDIIQDHLVESLQAVQDRGVIPRPEKAGYGRHTGYRMQIGQMIEKESSPK
jgi:hypothetical protein